MDLFPPNVGHAFYEMRCWPVPESVDHTNLAGLLTDFAKTNDFTDAELVASPIFRRFDNGLLHQTSLISIPQTELNKVLGDAIPAESFAAGRNETSGVELNPFIDSVRAYGAGQCPPWSGLPGGHNAGPGSDHCYMPWLPYDP